MRHGSGWNDAVLIANCTPGTMVDINQLALASSPERWQESVSLGASFAERARATLDDLGGASIGSDIAAMRHEFQQPRIFPR
nr:hypothetical protein [uncultured Gellertiella sp.]